MMMPEASAMLATTPSVAASNSVTVKHSSRFVSEILLTKEGVEEASIRQGELDERHAEEE